MQDLGGSSEIHLLRTDYTTGMSSPGPLSSGRRAVWTTLVQAETFTCVCTRPLARQARVRGGEQRGLLSPCHRAPAQCSRSLRIRHSKLVFQVVMKMYLSRGETRTYFISHFVSLIYNFQIFRHMVCEPPSALPLGPTNRCHLLPTLNIKCLLSSFTVLRPTDSMG